MSFFFLFICDFLTVAQHKWHEPTRDTKWRATTQHVIFVPLFPAVYLQFSFALMLTTKADTYAWSSIFMGSIYVPSEPEIMWSFYAKDNS